MLAESTATGFERLRADVVWRPVIAALGEHAWMSKDKEYIERFHQELASCAKGRHKVLPSALARRLQACFSTLVGVHVLLMLPWCVACWSCVAEHVWLSICALQSIDGNRACLLHCVNRAVVAGLGGVP